MVVGSQARILYADAEGRIKIAEAMLTPKKTSCLPMDLLRLNNSG